MYLPILLITNLFLLISSVCIIPIQLSFLDIELDTLSKGTEGVLSFFGPFQFHVIFPKFLATKIVECSLGYGCNTSCNRKISVLVTQGNKTTTNLFHCLKSIVQFYPIKRAYANSY